MDFRGILSSGFNFSKFIKLLKIASLINWKELARTLFKFQRVDESLPRTMYPSFSSETKR